MEENRISQLPIIILHAAKTERNRLRRFSALSAFLHAVVLAILLTWSGERLRNLPPDRLITVDLSQVVPSQPRLLQPVTHPPSKSAPVRLPKPAPALPPKPVPVAAKPQPSIPAMTTPSAPATPVVATTHVSQEASAQISDRPVVTAKPGLAVPIPSAMPTPPTQIPHVSRAADNAGIRTGYLQRCRSLIEHYKEYPVMARRGMVEGTVVIKGALGRDGLLRRCIVTKTSGSSLLDNAALRAVRSVERFPPVPPELHGDELVFELPVSFRLSME